MATSSLSLVRVEAGCFFCGVPLDDLGGAFLSHVDASVDCKNRYEAWMSHIDEDRPGG